MYKNKNYLLASILSSGMVLVCNGSVINNNLELSSQQTASATSALDNVVVFTNTNRRMAHVGVTASLGIQSDTAITEMRICHSSGSSSDNPCTTFNKINQNGNVYSINARSHDIGLLFNTSYTLGAYNGTILVGTYFFDTQPKYLMFVTGGTNKKGGNTGIWVNGAKTVPGMDGICTLHAESHGYDTDYTYRAIIGSRGEYEPHIQGHIIAKNIARRGIGRYQNWVLQPNSEYYSESYTYTSFENSCTEPTGCHKVYTHGTRDSYYIQTSNSNATLDFPWLASITNHDAYTWDTPNVWTGLDQNWRVDADNCHDWTSSSKSGEGVMGYIDRQGPAALFASKNHCDNPKLVACVQQPKTALIQPANVNNAPIDSAVEIQFGEQVDPGSVNNNSIQVTDVTSSINDNPGIPVDGYWTALDNQGDHTTTAPNNTNFLFTPSSQFVAGHKYQVEVMNSKSASVKSGSTGTEPRSVFKFSVNM